MDKEVRKGRTKIGEARGAIRRSNSFSQRVADGKVSVEQKTCPYCFHKKAFQYVMRPGYKCCRCGVEYE